MTPYRSHHLLMEKVTSVFRRLLSLFVSFFVFVFSFISGIIKPKPVKADSMKDQPVKDKKDEKEAEKKDKSPEKEEKPEKKAEMSIVKDTKDIHEKTDEEKTGKEVENDEKDIDAPSPIEVPNSIVIIHDSVVISEEIVTHYDQKVEIIEPKEEIVSQEDSQILDLITPDDLKDDEMVLESTENKEENFEQGIEESIDVKTNTIEEARQFEELEKLDINKEKKEHSNEIEEVNHEIPQNFETNEELTQIEENPIETKEIEQIEEKIEAPAQPEETPAQLEETPAQPEETPAQLEETPAQPEETPAQPEETPAQPEETPAQPEETPAQPEETPAQPEETPAQPEETPAQPEETPAQPEEKHEFTPKMLEKRKAAIDELIESEEKYCEYISIMLNVYKPRLAGLISNDYDKLFFGNIQPLILVSNTFSQSFKEQRDRGYEEAEIGLCFTLSAHFIKLFVPYISLYPEASQVLTQISNEKAHKDFIAKCDEIENEYQPLSSLIVMPVQRMPKYILLLKEIRKATPEWHTDYKLLSTAMDNMADQSHQADLKLNEAKRRSSLLTLQTSIKKCPTIIEANRTLIDTFPLADESSEMVVMSDLLFILKKGMMKKSKKSIEKNVSMRDIKSVEPTNHGFQIITKDGKIPVKMNARVQDAITIIQKQVNELASLKQRIGNC